MEVTKKFSDRALEDLELVERAVKKRDQAAYSELMKRYKESIYFMVLKMVNNRDDAEDLTIEAFGKAFNNIEKYSPEYAFSTWLFKIATNNTIDFIRKKRLATTSLDQTIETDKGGEVSLNIKDKGLNPEAKVIKNQRIELMRELITKLNPKYQALIELRYFQELSYDEISVKLDLPLGTVKAQLFRAKDVLYNLLKKYKAGERF